MLNISEGTDSDDRERMVFKDVKEIVSIFNEECMCKKCTFSKL